MYILASFVEARIKMKERKLFGKLPVHYSEFWKGGVLVHVDNVAILTVLNIK